MFQIHGGERWNQIEIFNLTKDTLAAKEVAEVCKKYNPRISKTNDEVPNWVFFI